MKTIGIIGSRRRSSRLDFEMLEREFLKIYVDGDRIVSGGCPTGGDRFAEILAKKYQVPIMIHYAQWDKLGKKAGFTRNTDIAKDGDVILALVASDRTGGAEDTLKKASAMGKKIVTLECDHDEFKPEIPPKQVSMPGSTKAEPEQTTIRRLTENHDAGEDIFSV